MLFIRSSALCRTCGGQRYCLDAGLRAAVFLIQLICLRTGSKDCSDVGMGQDDVHVVCFWIANTAVIGFADIASRNNIPHGDAVRECKGNFIFFGFRQRFAAYVRYNFPETVSGMPIVKADFS